ncbi:RHOMBOID-like protein 1 [Cynara cardunculus var. scolymus]|uniref:RHOMBOID-like protein 1 n=1 Tax=Cynara cardunculus var. scolymus TaxID=59895 RepID=UPI000D630E7C|nr:RHOMBOID-like protein 1 [Cynara cardunculus var. scolymus]
MVGKNSHGHIEIKVQSVPPPPPPSLFRPPYEWYPWIVTMFVNIDIIIFIVSMYINNCPAHSRNCIGAPTLQRFAFENIHQNPLLGPSTDTLVKMGALDADKVIRGGQQWRILTCMWLHAGVFHIFANMLSLLGVGVRLEQEFGFVRIGLVYILSGIGGSLLSALFVRKTISVGASGALFGLLGSMLSELLTNWTIYTNKMAALTTLIFMILINLMVGILPHVDNFAHIGGFVTGFFLGFILLIRPHFHWTSQPISPFGYYGHQRKTRYKLYQYILLILSIIVLIVMFTIGFVFLFREVDGNDYCSWCHYLSCVPTSLWSCSPQCNSTRSGNQLNLKCLSNGKSKSYMLPDGNDMMLIQELCANLCI